MKLYELEYQYLNLLDKIENGEIENEYILDSLEAIEGNIEHKIDNIACMIKQLQAESEALKKEADKLIERAKKKASETTYFMHYVQKTMKNININKIETSKNLIQIKKNPVSVIVEEGFINWAKENKPELIRIKTVEEADKTLIKEYLQKNELNYARLEQKDKLSIK